MGRSRSTFLVSISLLLLLGLAWWISLSIHLGAIPEDLQDEVRWLRSYRLCLAALTGSCLAIAGVQMQALFRNPLADPGIIGASAGASVGGLLALLLWPLLAPVLASWCAPEMILPAACLAGALIALFAVLMVLRMGGSTVTVLLFGVVLTLFLGSVGSFLRLSVQEDWQLQRALMGFVAGDIGDRGPRHIALIAPITLMSLLAAWGWHRHLDILQTGEDEASSLGLDVTRTRRWLIIWAALPVAASVAVAGSIAFVGLMVPHIMRNLIGSKHSRLLPLAALGGAVFTVLCDLLGHVPGPGRVIPLGIITGLLGAPLFIITLLRRQRQGLA